MKQNNRKKPIVVCVRLSNKWNFRYQLNCFVFEINKFYFYYNTTFSFSSKLITLWQIKENLAAI